MTEPDFWNDNIAAQKTSQELNELKKQRVAVSGTDNTSLNDEMEDFLS